MLEAAPVGNEEIADWLELAILASGQKGNTNHKILKWASDWANLTELQTSSGLKLKDFMRDPNDIRFYKKINDQI
jgi:hypothetical protein